MARLGGLSGTMRAHPRISAAIAAVAAAAAGTAIALAPGGGAPTTVDPRTRLSADYNACLLTGPAGTAGQPAAAVWAGIQKASLSTSERASRQSVVGAQTLADAETYINTLALRQCASIVAVGALPTQAAEQSATTFPAVRFIVVTSTSPQGGRPGNVDVVAATSPDTITDGVANALVVDFDRVKP
jgi:basic membrane lipoprotein Med (substrate-binding protein (PBP1-ABC) superfamily)